MEVMGEGKVHLSCILNFYYTCILCWVHNCKYACEFKVIRVLMWDMKPSGVDWELVIEAPVNPTFCLLLEMDRDMRIDV